MEEPRETIPSAESPGRTPSAPPASTLPVAATAAADGVDVSLIRWMLAMTPAQRLQTLQGMIASLARLRDGQIRD